MTYICLIGTDIDIYGSVFITKYIAGKTEMLSSVVLTNHWGETFNKKVYLTITAGKVQPPLFKRQLTSS